MRGDDDKLETSDGGKGGRVARASRVGAFEADGSGGQVWIHAGDEVAPAVEGEAAEEQGAQGPLDHVRRGAKLGWEVLSGAFQQYTRDNGTLLSAAIAFYASFSLAPLLLIGIAVAGFFFGEEAAQGLVVRYLEDAIGAEAATFIENTIERSRIQGGGFAALASLVMLFWGGLKVMSALKTAMNIIWNVEDEIDYSFKLTLRGYGRGLLLLPGMGLLIILSLVTSTLMTAFVPSGLLAWANHGIFFAFIAIICAAVYRRLPDVRIAWSDVWVGACFTALLFSLGKYAVGLYLNFSSPGSVFGAAGTLAVLMIWFFFSAMIFFFGAELTQVYSERWGSHLRLRGHAVRQEVDADGNPVEVVHEEQVDQDEEPDEGFGGAPVGA